MNIHLPDPLAIDWKEISHTVHPGERGEVTFQQMEAGEIKIRLAQYSPGYLADHWCEKGHIVQILEGQLMLEHQGAETMVMNAGMTYIVGDGRQPHRASSSVGATVMIFD
ncbi:MAG: DHCW motif cupin fold protein [Saprospiraceae bacterium]|nr:DHCW motif cupin fold protein [Saprospiraceae bacterium]